MSKTSLWADAVLCDRLAALNTQSGGRRRKRTPAHRRAPRRVGALRLMPVVVAGATLGIGACAGTAYAYFSATGTGSGQTGVGKLLPVSVEQTTATVTSPLYPGGTGTLMLTLTNPNAFSVTVVGVVQDGPVTVTGGGSACTSGTGATPGTSGVAVASAAATGLDLSVAAGPSVSTTVTIASGSTMSTTSNTTCQGASFHIPVTVTARS